MVDTRTLLTRKLTSVTFLRLRRRLVVFRLDPLNTIAVRFNRRFLSSSAHHTWLRPGARDEQFTALAPVFRTLFGSEGSAPFLTIFSSKTRSRYYASFRFGYLGGRSAGAASSLIER